MSLEPWLFKNIRFYKVFWTWWQTNNWVNLDQVCSWNSEKSRLLQYHQSLIENCGLMDQSIPKFLFYHHYKLNSPLFVFIACVTMVIEDPIGGKLLILPLFILLNYTGRFWGIQTFSFVVVVVLIWSSNKMSSRISNVKVIQPHVGLRQSLQHSQSHQVPKLTLGRWLALRKQPPPLHNHVHVHSRGHGRGSSRSPRSHGGRGGAWQHGRSSCRSCRLVDDKIDVDGKGDGDDVHSVDFFCPQQQRSDKEVQSAQESLTVSSRGNCFPR